MAHAFNLNTQEAETDGSLWVWGQPSLQSRLQDSQGDIENIVLENQKEKKN